MLLLVCPSRGRSQRIEDFILSVKQTTDPKFTNLLILLDSDDHDLTDYGKILSTYNVKFRIYDRSMDATLTTEIINRAFNEFNDYDYYSVTNDDIIYKTKGWDRGLAVKHRISSGCDDTMVEKYGDKHIGNVKPGEFPITSVICGDIVREIGWLQYPKLRHSCGDNIWFWIGKRSDSLYHDGQYHTSHESPYFGKAEVDETFKKSNAHDNMQDYYTYKEWLKYRCGKEVIKVQNLTKEKILCR